MFRSIFCKTLLLCFAALLLNGAASANTSGSDRILKRLDALEARIAALEAENRIIKQEALTSQRELRQAKDQNFRKSNAAIPASEAASKVRYSFVEPPPVLWNGIYWGASAGGARIRSSVNSVERDDSSGSGYTSFGKSTGRNTGEFIDLFAGWNAQLSRVVVGAQIEATAADLSFSSNGLKNYTYFGANNPPSLTASGDFRPQLAARWMTSALLRAGILVDDQTLVYSIGGWTGARFEARNVTDNPFYQPMESFWASGWTGGAGIERKMDSNWSIRAEYRYTSLGSVRTSDRFDWRNSTSFAQSSDRQSQYDQSLQSGRIGIAYSFNPIR